MVTSTASGKAATKVAQGVIQLDGVRKRFRNGNEALKGLNLSVQEGNIFGIIGPDGAGKTTALQIIAGVLEPSKGKVRVLGKSPHDARADLGYLPQVTALYPELTVEENLKYEAGLRNVTGNEFEKRRDELLSSMGLDRFKDRLSSKLSGGMKQKLELACALVSRPKLLLLDEPTTGVDPISRQELWRILAGSVKDGVTLVIATPSLEEAEFCDQVALMYEGEVHECGAPEELADKLGLSRIEALYETAKKARAAAEQLQDLDDKSITDVFLFGDRVQILVDGKRNSAESTQKMLDENNELRPQWSQITKPNLENVLVLKLRELGHKDAPPPALPRLRGNAETAVGKSQTFNKESGRKSGSAKEETAGSGSTYRQLVKESGSEGGAPAGNSDYSPKEGAAASDSKLDLPDTTAGPGAGHGPGAGPGPGAGAGAAIEAKGLKKGFAEFQAVKGIDLEVKYGEIFGLLGANGAGKTTTIKMLCGIVEPSDGEVIMAGQKSKLRSKQVRRQLGYMSQKFTLYDELTVLENLQFYASIFDIPRDKQKEKISWALTACGLEGKEKAIVKSLPRGWKQRIAFGASVMHEPTILFLDEPTAGVDPIARRQLWTMIRDMADHGAAVVVSTHFLEEASNCDRLVFMSNGEFVAQGTPEEIKSSQSGELIELDVDDLESAFQCLNDLEAWRVSIYAGTLHVILDNPGSDLPKIELKLKQANVKINSSRPVPFRLDDVFISVIQRSRGKANDKTASAS